GSRSRLGSRLLGTLLDVGGIDSRNIRKVMHTFLVPVRQDLVRVFKTWLMDGGNSPAACLHNNISGKAVLPGPLLHKLCLNRSGHAPGDAECFQNRCAVLIVKGSGSSCL